MAEDRNRTSSGRGRHERPSDPMDELDWLEEPAQPGTASRQGTRPQQQPTRQQAARQRPAQPSRQAQTNTASRQQAPRRTQQPIQWQEETPPRQRSSQPSRPPQRPAVRTADRSERSRRYVEVEPDDYRPRRRGMSKGSIPLIILVVVLVGGVLIAGYKLGSALLSYQRDRSAYNDLADQALSDLAEPNATQKPVEQQDPNAGQAQQPQSEAPFAVNWDYLKSVNSDVIGWIYCAGTQINYPVVQTSDNDYYLHRDFTTRQPNVAGTLFADPNSALGITRSNIIIYGHNMKDGSMFAAVESYVSQQFYDEHPVMYFLTPNQNYRIDLIAGRIVESSLDNYISFFNDDASYASYLNDITSHSFFATRASVNTSSQLVSLSTCDYSGAYNDPRFLLQGLLVPIV